MEPGWGYPEASGTWQDATSGSAIEEIADIEELGALAVCKARETGRVIRNHGQVNYSAGCDHQSVRLSSRGRASTNIFRVLVSI